MCWRVAVKDTFTHDRFKMIVDSAETRPLFLVTGCQKYRPYLEAALQRFADPRVRILGFVGDPSGSLTTPHWDPDANIVTLPVSDIYETLPAKVHAAFSWAAEAFPATPGIWKTDDDIVYGSKELLMGFLLRLVAEPCWGLFVGACPENSVNLWRIQNRFEDPSLRPRHQQAIYCYGHGYWLSRAALRSVIAAGDTYRASYLEDVCTGYVLNQAGIVPRRVPLPYRELGRGPELLHAT
jgi:hypothetical protein